jgi:phage-related baseplate assembly protein
MTDGMAVSSAISTLDLSQLASPDAIETISYEAIFADMLARLQSLDPDGFDALVASDPAYKILQVAAYYVMLERQKKNDGVRAVMLAYAGGADLDHIGANRGVSRLLIDAGDPAALPPVLPTYESDADYRRRIQLSPEGYTTAGSEGSYIYHVSSASGLVKDVQVISPDKGKVTVFVLSREGNGTAPQQLLNIVAAAVNAEYVRPLTDEVAVTSASVINYSITAELVMYPGPDAEVVRQAAEDALRAYVASVHRIGYDHALSGIDAALHRPGVMRVNRAEPSETLVASNGEVFFANEIKVTIAAATDV